MYPSTAIAVTSTLVAAVVGFQAGIVENLSFGHHGAIWSQDHHHIPGFRLSGEDNHLPDILSDRIVLTPPWPGHRRSAIWAENPEPDDEWELELEFRVNGPENGGGNFQLWYVKNKLEIETSSIYTVGKFDGLAIAIGQYGHHGASVRAFLNDHSRSYKDQHVDQLSFANCDFNYRNLGRFVHLKITHTHGGLELNVDHHLCFKSSSIKLASGNYFGVTASSAAQPDSIEVRSLMVTKPVADQHEQYHPDHIEDPLLTDQTHHQNANHHDGSGHDAHEAEHHEEDHSWYWGASEGEKVKDEPAAHFKNENERFQDLHDRVTMVSHQIEFLFRDLNIFKEQSEERHRELVQWVHATHEHAERAKHMSDSIFHSIEAVKHDIEGKDYREHLEQLHRAIVEGHNAVLTGVPHLVRSTSPRMGFFVFIVVVFQVMLLGSYIIYRRRKDSAPKKYL